MDLAEAIDQVDNIVDDVLCGMSEVKAEQLGLDRRAGYRLHVSDEAIAVPKSHDGSMQYYGGFEYVEKEYRVELGDYVFYLRDDSRVNGHIERWEEESEQD